MRALIEGQYCEALRFSLPVVGVTAVCCLLAIRWAVDQFNNESVLFRESERFGLGLWIRHLVRDREDTADRRRGPAVRRAAAGDPLLRQPRHARATNWNAVRHARRSIMLDRPHRRAGLPDGDHAHAPAAENAAPRSARRSRHASGRGLLALLLHPGDALAERGNSASSIRSARQRSKSCSQIDELFAQRRSGRCCCVIAVTPAICEELAFRGFILSGLRRMGHKWGAIVLTSVFFGLAHGILAAIARRRASSASSSATSP